MTETPRPPQWTETRKELERMIEPQSAESERLYPEQVVAIRFALAEIARLTDEVETLRRPPETIHIERGGEWPRKGKAR